MKILKIIGIIVVVVILGAVIWSMTWPSEAHMEKSITINAPVEKIFTVVNDFSQTKEWNPWMQIDPNAEVTYSDNTVGLGAYYTWSSENDQVGTGRQDIIESVENARVKTKMEFGGMNGLYTADFILEPNEEGTKVTWTYDAKVDDAMEKFFLTIVESFISEPYETGLAQLKTYVEGLPDPEPMNEEAVESDSTMVEEVAAE